VPENKPNNSHISDRWAGVGKERVGTKPRGALAARLSNCDSVTGLINTDRNCHREGPFEERRGVAHHLIDFVSPLENFPPRLIGRAPRCRRCGAESGVRWPCWWEAPVLSARLRHPFFQSGY